LAADVMIWKGNQQSMSKGLFGRQQQQAARNHLHEGNLSEVVGTKSAASLKVRLLQMLNSNLTFKCTGRHRQICRFE